METRLVSADDAVINRDSATYHLVNLRGLRRTDHMHSPTIGYSKQFFHPVDPEGTRSFNLNMQPVIPIHLTQD